MNKVHYSSLSAEWETPDDLFHELDAEFHFDLDPAATDENAKCEVYFTKEMDGLSLPWEGFTVFCNPPYGRELPKWVKKAAGEKALTVMLIPARTDTSYFHDYILGKAEIRFLRGRLKFSGQSNSAPFPSMVVIFRNEEK
ncbi:MAG: DNA N-6-adenine-methyltransferase [Patescibacteria group bacterium]